MRLRRRQAQRLFASLRGFRYLRKMPKSYTVTANWDPEARVFTSQSDIPGLVVEAGTFEEFVDVVRAWAPDVIAANLPEARGPHTLHVEARYDLAVA